MPVTFDLKDKVREYQAQQWRPARKSINTILKACCKEANIPDVTPLTIRHSVAFQVFKKAGPSAAKESLGVSDRSLQHYTRLHSGDRIKAVRAALHGTNETTSESESVNTPKTGE